MGLQAQFRYKRGGFELELEFVLDAGITVLSGASGSGKSTVLNILAGLLKPEHGKIMFNEELFFDSGSGVNKPAWLRRCGYLMQGLLLFPHLDVSENICFGIDKWPNAQKKERLLELLTLVRMEDLARRKISQLSGGQMQRVALARALAPGPEFLLLDEPFSALDPLLKEEMGAELKEVQSKLNLPVLFVTHARAEALQLAEKLIVLEQGKIKAQGDPVDLLSAAKHESDTGLLYSW